MPRVNYSGLFLWSRHRAFDPPVEPRRGNTAAESAAVFLWGNVQSENSGLSFFSPLALRPRPSGGAAAALIRPPELGSFMNTGCGPLGRKPFVHELRLTVT